MTIVWRWNLYRFEIRILLKNSMIEECNHTFFVYEYVQLLIFRPG